MIKNQYVSLCLFAASLMMGCFATSALSARSESVRIAVVNVQQVLLHPTHVEDMETALKKRFGPREQALLQEQRALDADMATFKRQQKVASKRKLSALTTKIVKERTAFFKKKLSLRREVVPAQNKAMKELLDTLKADIRKIATRSNPSLDIVLTTNAVAFSKSKYDITDKVKELFN